MDEEEEEATFALRGLDGRTEGATAEAYDDEDDKFASSDDKGISD